MIFYRYEVNPPMEGDWSLPAIECEEYVGVRQTACGWWIKLARHADEDWEKRRWVSNTARKRWAYPTKAEAWESLVIRKQRRATYLRDELTRAYRDNRVIAEWERRHGVPDDRSEVKDG